MVTFATPLIAKLTLASLNGSLGNLRHLIQCEKATFHMERSSADPPPQCEDVPNGAIYRATALRWEPQHTVTRRAEQSRAGKQTGSRVTQEVTQAREAGLGPAVGRIMV